MAKGKRAIKRVALPARPLLGRRRLLDADLVGRIARAVGSGAFLHVAAEANGVSRRTLFGWLERARDLVAVLDADGQVDARDLVYVDLLERVTAAHAAARLRAEGAVLDENPLAWLRYGPGRDHGPDAPGWTQAVREVPPEVKSAAEQLLGEALRQLGLAPDVDGVDGSCAAPPVAVRSTVEPVAGLGSAGTEDGGEEGDV